jgi:tripartite-type tricarboxylate transporter receptor subunit TctC
VVENKPGGNAQIGCDYVAKSAPDGYTLLLAGMTTHAAAPALYKKLPYDTIKDFAPIANIIESPLVVVVHPDVRATTLGEFVALAKANPGKLNYGHAGIFTGAHINVETLQKQAGISMQQIPFRGDAAILTSLLGGQTELAVNSTGAISTRPDVRPLAVFWDRRHPALPDTPSVTELGFPSSPPGFQGVFAPKGTPKPVIEALEKACEAAMRDATLKGFADKQGVPLVYLTSAQFTQASHADYELKGRIFKELNLKQE